MAICPHMKGSKCAEKYCDYWDDGEQRCSLALESHKRIEILNMILKRVEELLMDAKDEEGLLKLIQELNIVSVSKTIQ